MKRRVVLGGLAAAVAAPALAQTGGSPAPAQPGGASGMGQDMSQADMEHMQRTMQIGMVAMETSRIAQQKARNADLKQFAGFELAEQTTLAEVMRSMMDPAATATAGAQPPAMQMDAKDQEMVKKLQGAQAGAAFDKDYLEGQMEGHRALLQVQEQYLQSNPQNREHMNVAKMARGQIREHIALLEDIDKKMK